MEPNNYRRVHSDEVGSKELIDVPPQVSIGVGLLFVILPLVNIIRQLFSKK